MLTPCPCCTVKVSVTTRCTLTKIPNEPESTICAPAGFALSFLSPANNTVAHPRTTTAPHRIRALKVTAFFLAFYGFALHRFDLLPLRSSTGSNQAQSLNHLCRNLLDGFPARLLPERCLQVMRPPRLVKL